MLKDNLKILRESKGLTKKETALKLGISERAYLTYEYGEREPKLDTLQKLADFYGVTTDYLLGRPEAGPPEDPINVFAKNANLKELEKLLITEYLKLSDKQRESVINFMKKVIGNEEVRKALQKKEVKLVMQAARDGAPPGLVETTPEEEEELLNTPLIDPDL